MKAFVKPALPRFATSFTRLPPDSVYCPGACPAPPDTTCLAALRPSR